jgi:hypothetical protein
MAGDLLVIILSSGPRTGKSTARAAFARELGMRGTSTSDIIASVLEQERGLPSGTVAADRNANSALWRSELREVGDRIGLGSQPAIVRAIEAGFRVIDGCRRARELDAGLRRAAELGLTPLVVWIAGREAVGGDNTEAALLRERATVEIRNDGTVADFERAISRQIAAMTAGG